jgi:hypothetical protein
LFDAWCKKNGHKIPETRTHETGSGGKHYLFQYPQNGQYGNKSFKKLGFDIRGNGGQIVAPGSKHPDTGNPYKVVDESLIAPAPTWMLELYKEEPQPEPTSTTAYSGDIDSLPISAAKKSDILNGEVKGGRSEKIMGVCNALVYANLSDSDIFRIFDRYAIGEKYREKGRGKKWLQGRIDKARRRVTDRATKSPEKAPETKPDDKSKEQGGFNFVHAAEVVENLKPIEWTIYSILVTSSMYYIFGDPGTFKTFLELCRGLCIAAGIAFFGHATRQGTVFYICGEGQQGIGRRIAALCIAHNVNIKDIPFFIATVPMQLSDQQNVEAVMRAIDALAAKYGPPELVIIDTLARNFGDGDENSTRDMSLVIQNLDKAFGNDFCRGLIHHTGHSNKDRGRGSMALKAAVDSEFQLSLTTTDQILMECKKQKDAPKAEPMLFDKRSIPLLIGGVKDSSLVLDLVSEGDSIKKSIQQSNISDAMGKALDQLKRMGGHLTQVDFKNWRSQCIKKKFYKRTDNFNKAFEKMRKMGLVKTDLLKTTACLCENNAAESGGKIINE